MSQPAAGQKLEQSNRNMDGLGQDINCSKSQDGITAGFHTPQGMDLELHGLFNLTFQAPKSGTLPLSLIHAITHHTCDKLDRTLCPPCTYSSTFQQKGAACYRVPACPAPPRYTYCLKTPGLRLRPTHRLNQP